MKWKLVVIAGALLIATGTAARAADGAALYKTKCSGCHGANGEGKPSMKAPAIKGTELSVDKLVDHLMKGEPTSKPPHKKGISGLSDEQAKAIAEYVKTLK
jgi:mono/diheme cytochrome c family protein